MARLAQPGLFFAEKPVSFWTKIQNPKIEDPSKLSSKCHCERSEAIPS
jgi:hypothetical protein